MSLHLRSMVDFWRHPLSAFTRKHSLVSWNLLLPILLAQFLCFCSSEDTDAGESAADGSVLDAKVLDATDPDVGVPTPDASVLDAAEPDAMSVDALAPLGCGDFVDLDDFVVVQTKGKTKFDNDYQVQRIFFTGIDDSSNYGRRSIIKIVAYEGLTGYPSSPGVSVDLSQVGQADRDGFLVKHGVDCDDRGHLCQTWFWAYEGSANISAIDWSEPVGSTLAGSLSDVLFREVTLDVNELPALVQGGCSFTLSRFSWSEIVSLAAG